MVKGRFELLRECTVEVLWECSEETFTGWEGQEGSWLEEMFSSWEGLGWTFPGSTSLWLYSLSCDSKWSARFLEL